MGAPEGGHPALHRLVQGLLQGRARRGDVELRADVMPAATCRVLYCLRLLTRAEAFWLQRRQGRNSAIFMKGCDGFRMASSFFWTGCTGTRPASWCALLRCSPSEASPSRVLVV